MKLLFLILFFMPLLSSAQFGKARFDSTARFVSLPLKQLDLSVFSGDRSKSSYQYVVTNDTMYYKIFARYKKDSLPTFDFSKQELVFSMACTQCLALCPTIEPCHRNACRYTHFWATRDKPKRSN
jgi:hypothetical protein